MTELLSSKVIADLTPTIADKECDIRRLIAANNARDLAQLFHLKQKEELRYRGSDFSVNVIYDRTCKEPAGIQINMPFHETELTSQFLCAIADKVPGLSVTTKGEDDTQKGVRQILTLQGEAVSGHALRHRLMEELSAALGDPISPIKSYQRRHDRTRGTESHSI